MAETTVGSDVFKNKNNFLESLMAPAKTAQRALDFYKNVPTTTRGSFIANRPGQLGITENDQTPNYTPLAAGTPPAGSSAGTGSGGSGDQTPYGAFFGAENPDRLLGYLLRQGGYASNQDNPFVQFMGRMVSGLPDIFSLQGMAGEDGSAGFKDYMSGIMNQMRSTGVDYANSPLFNRTEMANFLTALAGGGTGMDSASWQAIQDMSAADALETVKGMIGAMGVTALTPLQLRGVISGLENDFSDWFDNEQFASGLPAGGADGGANDFIRYLTTQGKGILDRFF